MNLESLSFKKKIMLNFILVIALFAAILGLLLFNQHKLGALQDQGAHRFTDAEEISHVLLAVSEVYAVAADAQINQKYDETKKDLEKIKKEMEDNIAIVQKIADTNEEKKWADEFKNSYHNYVGTFEQELLPELLKNGPGAKTKELDGKVDELRDLTMSFLKKIAGSIENESHQSDKDFDQTFRDGLLESVASALIVSIVGLSLAFYMSHKIATTLNQVNQELIKSYNDIAENAKRVAAASENLSNSTTEQASAIQETSATMEEMNSMIKKTAESALESNQLTKVSTENAIRGKETSEQLMQSVQEIEQSNRSMMEAVESGNNRIGEIVVLINEIATKTKIINEIVFQTKLLSFNASVEAARAGEQGKGFAVVADEIGNLAEMSGKAAQDISNMLENSTQKVKQVIADTQLNVNDILNKGNRIVRQGIDVADQTAQILALINKDIKEVSSNMSEISNASDEQSKGADQVTLAIHQMDQATHMNANLSKELFSYSQELTQQTHRLEKAMEDLQALIKGRNS